MQNKILLALTLVVVGVTGLNSYITQTSVDYFTNASLYEARELSRQLWVSRAQDAVSDSQKATNNVAKIALGFRDERDVAVGAYNELYDQAVGMYQTMKDMERYIQVCIKALTTIGVKVPKPDATTFPPADWKAPEYDQRLKKGNKDLKIDQAPPVPEKTT